MKKISTLFIAFLSLVTFTFGQFSGELDSTFNLNGKQSYDFGLQDNLTDVKIQKADQKIVTVGTALNSSFGGQLIATRLNTDGSFDGSFGTAGKVLFPSFTESYAYEAQIRQDGKILIAGAAANPSYQFSILLMRLKTDGTLDSTFGVNGIALPRFGLSDEFAYAMIEQDDHKIVIAGTSLDTAYRNVPMVARFKENGQIDSTFGLNGISYIPVIAIDNEFTSIVIQPDGKIIASGHYSKGLNTFGSDNFDGLVARFNTNGSLDTSFGNNGVVLTPVSVENIEDYFGLKLTKDGKILAAGFATLPNYTQDAWVTRYENNGKIDSTFATNGRLLFNNADSDYANDIEIQADDKIVIAGSTGIPFGGTTEFFVARYSADGLIDSSFSVDGYVLTQIDTLMADANGIAIQADQKIVAAGKGSNGTNNDIAIVRYQADAPTSLSSPLKINNLIVYPNPAQSEITIESPTNQPIQIEVLSTLGEKILQKTIVGREKIDISHLPSGVYWIKDAKGNGGMAFIKE